MKYNLSFDTADLTFVTTASNSYINFVEPFITFCKESNPCCKIEIWVDNPNKVSFDITDVKIHQLPDNYNVATYRYIAEPTFDTKYTYITDIDIMHTEFVQPFHLWHMNSTDLPFSNVRRDDKGRTDRMSGLHFVKTSEWYTATKQTRKNIEPTGQDEQMLLEIASSLFDINAISSGLANRPVHGIHCSTEGKPRDPYAKLGWEITSQKVAYFKNVILKHGVFNEYFKTKVCIPLLGKKFIDKMNKHEI